MDQNEADWGLEDRDMDGALTEAIVTIVAIVLTVEMKSFTSRR